MKLLVTTIFTASLLLLTACNHTAQKSSSHSMNDGHKHKAMEKKMMEQKVAMNDSNQYKAYSAEAFNTLKGNDKFAVFFHADWCGTCKRWEQNLKDNMSDLSSKAMILKADYDAEQALVKDLHVKKQSSAVMFNAKGEIVEVLMDPSIEALNTFFESADNDVFAATGNKYKPFDASAYQTMKGQEKMVLFFHADWCGTCRKWEKNLQASVSTFPANTRIMKVNYDQAGDLKKEYGVTKQSMAVFLNADGSVAKTVGDPSVEMLKDFFNEAAEVAVSNKVGQYKAYSAQAMQEVNGKDKYVVFFHADWCPTCVKWDSKTKASLDGLPSNTVIFKADFDKNLELKKQYGVTKQSMAVFVNQDGSVSKVEGDPSVDSIKAFFTS